MIDPTLIARIPEEFAAVKPFLAQNLLPYIALKCEEVGYLDNAADPDLLNPWESKVGGYPYLPKGMDYPKDEEADRFLMFLGQMNCADVPEVEGFNFPKQGLLQFYTGYVVPMGEWGTPQHYIRYFPEFSKNAEEVVGGEVGVAHYINGQAAIGESLTVAKMPLIPGDRKSVV